MAHGVLHRVQQQVRACPQTGSLPCSCASSVLRGSTAQGCRGHHMGSSPRLLQLLIGTRRLARAALRGCRDVHCCGASVDAGFSSTRLADLCLCADAPRAVASVCGRRRAVSWSATAAGTRADPPSPCRPVASLAHICCKPAAHIRAAYHSLPGTQGGQYTALCSEEKGSSARSPSAQYRAALSSTSARRDDSLSSHDLPGSLH